MANAPEQIHLTCLSGKWRMLRAPSGDNMLLPELKAVMVQPTPALAGMGHNGSSSGTAINTALAPRSANIVLRKTVSTRLLPGDIGHFFLCGVFPIAAAGDLRRLIYCGGLGPPQPTSAGAVEDRLNISAPGLIAVKFLSASIVAASTRLLWWAMAL
jgi:hypothetical protein